MRGNQLKCAKFTDLELLSICCAKETVSFVIIYREGEGESNKESIRESMYGRTMVTKLVTLSLIKE